MINEQRIKRPLQSECLFEAMDGGISKEDCERTVKEIRIGEIWRYMDVFKGYVYQSKNELSEERLDEIASALKFIFRIESLTQPTKP
jgi:hypothetical protein